jgi:serine-protein kinase ATM
MLHIGERSAREVQVQMLLSAVRLAQNQSTALKYLGTVTYLSDLAPICIKAGLDVELDIQEAVSDILWAQDEQIASIQILSTCLSSGLAKQPGKSASILAKLASDLVL